MLQAARLSGSGLIDLLRAAEPKFSEARFTITDMTSGGGTPAAVVDVTVRPDGDRLRTRVSLAPGFEYAGRHRHMLVVRLFNNGTICAALPGRPATLIAGHPLLSAADKFLNARLAHGILRLRLRLGLTMRWLLISTES